MHDKLTVLTVWGGYSVNIDGTVKREFGVQLAYVLIQKKNFMVLALQDNFRVFCTLSPHCLLSDSFTC